VVVVVVGAGDVEVEDVGNVVVVVEEVVVGTVARDSVKKGASLAHVKVIVGGAPAGNSIRFVYDGVPFTSAKPEPTSQVVHLSPTPGLKWGSAPSN
jgi:hypothetical protein